MGSINMNKWRRDRKGIFKNLLDILNGEKAKMDYTASRNGLEANITIDVHCPECGQYMSYEGDGVECQNIDCRLYRIAFEGPKIELKPVVDLDDLLL
jgi:hypothetical protein